MVSGKSLRQVQSEFGQASVELLAVIPLVLVLGWGVWQAAIAGLTAERAAHAARVASRASAVGANARKAVERVLPKSLLQNAVIQSRAGRATVRLRVPSVLPGLVLGTVTAAASFPEQT